MPLYGSGIAIAIAALVLSSAASASILHYEGAIESEYATYGSLETLSAIHSNLQYLDSTGACNATCLNAVLTAICESDYCTASHSGNASIVTLGRGELYITAIQPN